MIRRRRILGFRGSLCHRDRCAEPTPRCLRRGRWRPRPAWAGRGRLPSTAPRGTEPDEGGDVRVLTGQLAERRRNLPSARNAELHPKRVAVCLCRPGGDPERAPHLVVRAPGRDQRDHFALAVGQRRLGCGGRPRHGEDSSLPRSRDPFVGGCKSGCNRRRRRRIDGVRRDADIVVVGAGIVGAATAPRSASAAGSVSLLEQFDLGHARGSSHGTSRIFRLNYPDERFVRLAQAADAAWRELEQRVWREADRARRLARPRAGRRRDEQARSRRVRRARTRRCRPTRSASRWPLRLEPDETAVFQPDGGMTVRGSRLRGAPRRLRARRGVERPRPGTPVRALALERRSVRLTLDDGELGTARSSSPPARGRRAARAARDRPAGRADARDGRLPRAPRAERVPP